MDDDLIEIPFEVYPPEHGTRADVFLSRRIKRMSRARAQEIIRDGNLRKSDAPIDKPSVRVFSGDEVLLKRRKLEEAPIDDIEVPLVYEDDDFIGVNKPGNLVVHPTASAYNRTLIRVLRVRRPDEYLSLAHRIDKETSGLILVAKTKEAERHLKMQFAERRVRKSYLAIVEGRLTESEQLINAPMRLDPDSESGVLMVIGGEGAAPSETEITVLSEGPDATLVEARPRTGRQHQIRLHLAYIGHPIVGDKLYLGGEALFLRSIREGLEDEELEEAIGHVRHALHAHKATFEHPSAGGPHTVTAPMPPDMIELARRLGIVPPPALIDP